MHSSGLPPTGGVKSWFWPDGQQTGSFQWFRCVSFLLEMTKNIPNQDVSEYYIKNVTICLCVFFLRGSDTSWVPYHWHGAPAEGCGKDNYCHNVVCSQREPWPRDLLVQRHASCGHQQQQRANQTAAFRWILLSLSHDGNGTQYTYICTCTHIHPLYMLNIKCRKKRPFYHKE